MKKKRVWFSPGGDNQKLRQKFRKMKLTFIFSMLVLLSFGNGFSQAKVSIHLEKASIQQVMDILENQTGHVFLYKDGILDMNQKYSFDYSDEPFEEVLKGVCETAGVDYEIRSNRQILLKEKVREVLMSRAVQQQQTVTGVVTDQRGQSMPGVTVVVKGTTTGTVTDAEGRFKLDVPAGRDILQFSFVGMRTQEISLEGRSTITVAMDEETIGMDEIIVVGYGTQKKANLTGSLEVVSGDDLASRPAAQTSQLLQGQSPSMLITMGLRGAEPGAGQKIQVRGIGSITGDASPLVLVDGVEMDMNLVDPSSIENITILKDASASAVYGSRAAFGVILIQTKRGSDRPMRLSYSNITSANVPYYVPDMLDSYTYATMFNQANANAGLGPVFGPEQMERIKGYMEGTYPYPYNPEQPPFSQWRGRWDGNANINWPQLYFKDYSIQQKHNINLEGGDEKNQYYATIGYQDQPGVMTWGNDRYQRYNILANVSSQVNDWARFDFSGRFARTERDYPNGGVWNDRSGYWMHINILWPTMPQYNIDGTLHNPIQVALMDGGRILTNNNNARFSIGTELEPVTGWKTNVRYNYTYRAGTTTNTLFPVPVHIADGSMGNIGFPQTGLREELRTGHYSVFTAYSQFEKSIQNHYFSVMAGFEQDYEFNRNMYGEGSELISVEVPSISTALGTKVVDDVINHWATQGIFGRVNYNFNEKYLLEVSARYDGSSRFEKGQRWGFFPSASVGYTISRENFWAAVEPVVQLLKIRASYGSLGNQTIIGSRIVRSGQAFSEVLDPNVANYLYLEEIPITQRLGRIIDGVRPNYAGMPGIRSENLTWETVTTANLGIEAGFLNNRMLLEADLYNRVTDNMMGPSIQLPSVLGAGAPTANNAKLETKGYEISLSWRDRIENFAYHAKVSLGDYQATILEYVNETRNVHTWYAGKKHGDVWGLTTDGIIQQAGEPIHDQSYYYATWGPGDIKYVDLTGEGVIDPGEQTLDNHGDLSIIANTTPRYLVSLTSGFNWGSWDFNMFWQGIGSQPFVPLPGSEFYWGHVNNPNSAILIKDSYHLDYWRPADETNFLGPNTDSYKPKPYFSSERNKNLQTQTRFIDNARYFRLKNLQIGYTLPQTVIGKLPIEHLRVYFSGENLLTLQSLPKGYEPENMVASDTYMRTYPIYQMYSLGLNISF